MKYFYILIAIFILNACNSSVSTTDLEMDPLYEEQWYMEKDSAFYTKNNINSEAHIHPKDETYELYTGNTIKVAVIDDGFDVNHPEIKDKIIATVSMDGNGNVISTDVSHTNTNEHHGTAVTGIIASQNNTIGLRGIAPNVELILIKMPDIFSDIGEIALFNKAVEYGADIINCSWGTYSVTDVVRTHLNTLSNTARDGKGVIIVFASGNKDIDIENDEASIQNIISVGATSENNLRTSYSNYGNTLDIVAPGGDLLGITTIDPLSSDGVSSDEYNRYNEYDKGEATYFVGTSASAPILTGAIALLLEKDPSLTREEVQTLLKQSVDHIGLNTPYLDEMVISTEQTPTISGLLGTSGNSDIVTKLLSDKNGTSYGPYTISVNGDNTFFSSVTDTLPEGKYTITLLSSDQNHTYATLKNFEVNTSKESLINKEVRKSDFYGYGKLNLGKLLE